MSDEDQKHSEYHSCNYGYRIPDDDIKRVDNEFCAQKTPKKETGGENRPLLGKQLKRMHLLAGTMTVVVCTSVISGESSARETESVVTTVETVAV